MNELVAELDDAAGALHLPQKLLLAHRLPVHGHLPVEGEQVLQAEPGVGFLIGGFLQPERGLRLIQVPERLGQQHLHAQQLQEG